MLQSLPAEECRDWLGKSGMDSIGVCLSRKSSAERPCDKSRQAHSNCCFVSWVVVVVVVSPQFLLLLLFQEDSADNKVKTRRKWKRKRNRRKK